MAARRRAWIGPLRTVWPYLGLLLLVVSLAAVVAAPLSGALVQRWSDNDARSRSQLIDRAVGPTLAQAIAAADWPRVSALFADAAADEHVLALGVCSANGELRAATAGLPGHFSCAEALKPGFSRRWRGGKLVLSGSFPLGPAARGDRLVVLQDVSFINTRSGEAQALALAVLAATALAMAAAATLAVVVITRRWMGSLRVAVASASGAPEAQHGGDAHAGGQDAFMTEEIRRVIRAFDSGRAAAEPSEVDWTPASLQSVLREVLPGAEVIVLANREPYIHNRTEDGIMLQTPASGLVSALEPVMRAAGGVWIAHGSGTADRETVDATDGLMAPPDNPAYRLRRIWISDEEQDGYYYGFANEGLWPLCHIAFVRPIFRESDWNAYQAINQRFADAVVEEARTEDPVVLVQDYHFALAPRMIRERLPKATIVTFWHIPWPNAETFGVCPWKNQIIEGLLGSTILGFHTQFHCNNFMETVDRFVESRIDREHSSVSLGGDETLVRPYPISIAWPAAALEGQPPIEACRATVRAAHGLDPDTRIAVGIERFDYTKGILDRLRAVDAFLDAHPQWRGKFAFIQVAAPTRSKLPSYGRLQEEALELTEAINAKHGSEDYRPIHLVVRHHEPKAVFELFRAADFCVVSSLHDGMNLVAKEFVAARDDDQGVLVLSSFTGAARELSEALIVNPYNPAEMAAAFDQALQMPPVEQRERMRMMREHVRARNVYRWAGTMLTDAARTRQLQRIHALAQQSA
ncbi:MAG TPA: trehalose-6-phosphate synthase [Caulobacteraceae bacterium]|nr:trehalose-6-phosphate synthase [Caulobacteraceae bacterium]